MDGAVPKVWELRWSLRAALRAAAGPLLVAGAWLVLWIWVQRGGGEDLSGERTRFLVTALEGPPGSWLCLAGVAFLAGAALLTALAPLRRLPSIRLDDDGITSWTETRLRRVSWDEVTSIGLSRTVAGHIVLEVRLTGRRAIRMHDVMFDDPLPAILESMREWLHEHGSTPIPFIGLNPDTLRKG